MDIYALWQEIQKLAVDGNPHFTIEFGLSSDTPINAEKIVGILRNLEAEIATDFPQGSGTDVTITSDLDMGSHYTDIALGKAKSSAYATISVFLPTTKE